MKNKKVFVVIICILVIAIIFIGLVTKIIPNPFIDTSNLVCERKSKIDAPIKETIVETYKFNFLGKLKSVNIETIYSSDDVKLLESLKEEYDKKDYEMNTYDNKIIIMQKNVNQYDNKLTRKKLVSIYASEGSAYECE